MNLKCWKEGAECVRDTTQLGRLDEYLPRYLGREGGTDQVRPLEAPNAGCVLSQNYQTCVLRKKGRYDQTKH